MTNDNTISFDEYKLKIDEQIKARHDKRLTEAVDRINQMANQGKVLVVCESRDGKTKYVENLDEVLKNYTDWGFSPGHTEKRGCYRSFYIPKWANIPMFQDLYHLKLSPMTENDKEQGNED